MYIRKDHDQTALGVLGAMLGDSWEINLCVMVSSFLSFNYFGRTLLFLSAGTAHYYRIYLLLTFLSQLIRVVVSERSVNSTQAFLSAVSRQPSVTPSQTLAIQPETNPNFPVLQLSPQNVRSLMSCMDIVLHFGERYKRRIDAFLIWVLG